MSNKPTPVKDPSRIMARLFLGAGKPGVTQRMEGNVLIVDDATHRMRIILERRTDVQ